MGKNKQIGIFLLLLLGGIFYFSDPGLLLPDKEKSAAAAIERYLVKAQTTLKRDLQESSPSESWNNGTTNTVTYQQGTPKIWQNNLVFPPENLQNLLNQHPTSYFLYESPGGKFVVWKWDESVVDPAYDSYGMVQILAPHLTETGETVWCLAPEIGGNVNHQYQLSNRGSPILSPAGDPITTLELSSPITHGPWWYLLFLMYLGLLFFFSGLAFKLAGSINRLENPVLKLGIDLLILIGVYTITNPFSIRLIETAPFMPEPSTGTFLGRLVCGSVILTQLSLFGLSYWKSFKLPRSPIAMGAIAYLGLTGGMFGILKIFELVVFSSGIDFYFQDVFHIQSAAWIAIGSLLLLIILQFIWSYRLFKLVLSAGLKPVGRILTFVVALSAILVLHLFVGAKIPILFFVVGAMGVGILMDLFVDNSQRDMTWLILWLMMFAVFTSMMLYTLENNQPVARQEKMAATLASPVDPLLEYFLPDSPEIDSPAANQLENIWRVNWNEHPYLSVFYNYAIFSDSSMLLAQPALRVDSNWNYQLAPLPGYRIEISRKANPEKSWSFGPFESPAFRGLKDLDRYDYAVYAHGILVLSEKETSFPSQIQPNKALTGINTDNDAGKHFGRIYDDPSMEPYDAFVYSADRVVKLRQKNRNLMKPFSLFAFLFCLLFLFTPVLGLVNSRFHWLPQDLRFNWSTQSSLGNRIQISVLALIVISFLTIGGITVKYFKNTERAEIMEQNRQRLDAVLAEIESIGEHQAPDAFQLNRIARSHRQEIRYYDLQSNLQLASDGLPNRMGIIPQHPPWNTWQEILQGLKGYRIETERMGARLYQVVYHPDTDAGGKLRGIYGFPLDIARGSTEGQLTGFFGPLLTVYVFLLLITGTVSIAIANSITQPLTNLRNSLTQVELGRNEPIPYQRQDELGILISEYNHMLEKLEEATRQLSQTEREGAWREMAKKVAHEIKNPLTPMKLSIQLLQRVLKSDPAEAAPLFDRTSQTLIEQIDALSEIASAFSSFAQMPKADQREVDLGEVLQSAQSLFVNEAGNMEFPLEIPSGEFPVLADKNQLLRVFNNLYKNAIQSIPPERTGEIKTRLELINDQTFKISICDNGSGIPEHTGEQVFVPSFTTKSSGSGLGLAMSKSIVESFGGKIYFKSSLTAGTCFFIELPQLSKTN